MPFIKMKASSDGFTLVEVLITLLLGGIIMTSVMTSFFSQHKAYRAQEEIVTMQQNLRSAMDLMAREIRMAGYDPTGDANAGIIDATATELEFTMDLLGDGATDGPNEHLAYRLNNNATIGRWTGGIIYQPVAENFEALEFNYIMADGSTTTSPGNTDNIRGVQITLLARSDAPDPNYTDTRTYETGSGAIWEPDDNYLHHRRKLLIRTVMCRNLGL